MKNWKIQSLISQKKFLNTIIGVANHELIKVAHSDVKLEGMGTTLVVPTVIGNTLYFAKCGETVVCI